MEARAGKKKKKDKNVLCKLNQFDVSSVWINHSFTLHLHNHRIHQQIVSVYKQRSKHSSSFVQGSAEHIGQEKSYPRPAPEPAGTI